MKKTSKAEMLRATEIRDLGVVLSTVEGRRFCFKQIEESGVFKSTFAVDPYVTAFQEGARSKGLKLIADITGEYPDAYLAMMREARNEEVNNDGRSGKYDTDAEPGSDE